MIDKKNVITFKENTSFTDMCKCFNDEKFTRVPVLSNDGKSVIGIINEKDVFSCLYTNNEKKITDLMSEPLYVSYRKLLSDALEEIQKSKSHMAIVVDNMEDREYMGIITLEDITEELIGEVYDEYDDVPRVFEIGNHIYQVDGKLSIDYLFDKYLVDTTQPQCKSQNVDGWIREIVNVPKKNDEVYYDNLKIKILEVLNHHVKLVEIEVLTDYDEE